jgi:beta-aspartyl-peptidase (threonine type)
MTPAIVVHGGAGRWVPDSDRLAQALEDCRRAAAAGQAVLTRGGPAVEAVEQAVLILEDSPVFDAGRGSYLNAAGYIELDAMIMDGATLNLGAVAAVQRIKNPIALARQVMAAGEHTFLVAAGAEEFARSLGTELIDNFELLAGEELEAYRNWPGAPLERLGVPEAGTLGDTVGAVALDAAGNVAAATSTGGTRRKRPGRVGDSPLVGSGAYADNWTAAVSATGHGEDLMRVVISKRVCDFVAAGLGAQRASEAALDVLAERVRGEGGIIAVDIRGGVGVAYNTTAMVHAYAVGDGAIVAGR